MDRADSDAGGVHWTARHNACRLVAGAPTIVAGSADVPSYLGLGLEPGASAIDSYDHGAGHLIENMRIAGALQPAEGYTTRFRMNRGRNARITHAKRVALQRAEPIERLMKCFETHGAMRAVARLRPIATLKN